MFRQKYSFTCVFSDNLISKVDTLEPAKLARLHTLELRGNKLTTTDGFNLPNLKNLFLVRYSFWYVYNKCLFAVGLIVWFIWYGISVGFLIMSPKQSLGDIVFAPFLIIILLLLSFFRQKFIRHISRRLLNGNQWNFTGMLSTMRRWSFR